jgi:hypothetical protein
MGHSKEKIMKQFHRSLRVFVAALLLCSWLSAQQTASSTSTLTSTTTTAVVPRLVNYSGKATDEQGKAVTGIAGITFAIYSEQSGGAPLWLETQSVQLDNKGGYTAQLGATKPAGLPLDLFTQGEARWLGVRINGGEEQPRVLLLSVPYALKAEDASTLGGLPASAFMLAGAPVSMAATADSGATPSALPPATVSGSGTADYLPLWSSSSALANSVLYQLGSGSSAKIGINTITPAATLDIAGGETVRGLLNLPAAATATSAAGADSRPFGLVASTFNSGTHAAANQVFHWQAEPAGNNTASPSATLNLLFATAPNATAETGLSINNKGQITFASGQNFPGTGTGNGTVTSVGLSAPSSDFTVSGSPVTGSGTLGLTWTVAPSPSPNPNSIVKRDAAGSIAANLIIGNEVEGEATSDGYGVVGTSSSGVGVYGSTQSFVGVSGAATSGYGVFGFSESGDGVLGQSENGNAVAGETLGTAANGVYGLNHNNYGNGVYGHTDTGNGSGVAAINDTGEGDGLYAYAPEGNSGYAAFIDGDLDVDGVLHKASGTFKIDHPLDPANKYLYHSFVESPDMMNIYNGNVTTDAQGDATVSLPDYFEALNSDYRYQLTVMGQFAQAIVSNKVANHQFSIKTDKPNVEVSWQVTGIRQDAWANAHRVQPEVMKAEKDRGLYLHPELFGAPIEKSISMSRHPMVLKLIQERAASAGNPALVAHKPLVKAPALAKP